MKRSFLCLAVVCIGILLCGPFVVPVSAQLPVYSGVSVDGFPIPDVNKPYPSNPNDGSCWLASASNLLGAAGYGMGGDAQSRADSIYQQLIMDWGISSGGAPDQAICYWLAKYGQNPDAPEYQPLNDFTDVTAKFSTLAFSDYNFLQRELERGLYVGVQFANPAHAVTFVGWDDRTTPTRSYWTDSDQFTGYSPHDNSFITTPSPQWDILWTGATPPTTYLQQANGYVTLGLGLDKPEDAKMEYDVAWFPSPIGPTFREAGVKAPIYDDPVSGLGLGWQSAWTDPLGGGLYQPFRIDNEEKPDYDKTVSLLVDYFDHDPNYIYQDIRLRYNDKDGIEVVAVPTSAILSIDNGQVLFTWELDYQPAWEELLFPSYDYQHLEGIVASWDVATICTFDGLPGDANHDNVVDASDATILAGNWQAGPGATWEMGDFNADGFVNASDATILAGNWQASAGTAVPEPSTCLMLLGLFGLGVVCRYKILRS
ncbi:MAG: dockerin type I domain-containing protein [Planctomycetia bacterium]|jgi:hypothetical protein